MKKLILSLLAVSLFVSVPMNAQVSKMRAIKCAIPYLHQRFQCTPAEIQMGKKWLTGASVALVVAVLAALGLSAQQARKAKRQAEQELSSTQAKMAEQQAEIAQLTGKAQEAKRFEQATKSLRIGFNTNMLWMVESGLQRGANPDGGVGAETYLEIAAKNGNKEMVELLLEHGAAPELSPGVQTTTEIKNIIMNTPRRARKPLEKPIFRR